MAMDAGADREAQGPDDEELDAQAEERAADEGMPPPHESPETRFRSRNDEVGTDGADISGPVAGDDWKTMYDFPPPNEDVGVLPPDPDVLPEPDDEDAAATTRSR